MSIFFDTSQINSNSLAPSQIIRAIELMVRDFRHHRHHIRYNIRFLFSHNSYKRQDSEQTNKQNPTTAATKHAATKHTANKNTKLEEPKPEQSQVMSAKPPQMTQGNGGERHEVDRRRILHVWPTCDSSGYRTSGFGRSAAVLPPVPAVRHVGILTGLRGLAGRRLVFLPVPAVRKNVHSKRVFRVGTQKCTKS